MALLARVLKFPLNLVVTLLLWVYFTLGYLLFFLPLLAAAHLMARSRAASFQHLNRTFFRVFFRVLGVLAPVLRIRVSPEIPAIRSSVIVCNHVSYLDPILLISLVERAVTIVKATFFQLPLFSWNLRNAGYLPAPQTTNNEMSLLMWERLEDLRGHLEAGGNLFVFPEGTRGRSGSLQPFHKGVFRIASRCRAPIDLVLIRNTDRLFARGSFLFNIGTPTRIEVEWLGRLRPDYSSPGFSLQGLVEEARRIFLASLEVKARGGGLPGGGEAGARQEAGANPEVSPREEAR